MSKGKCLYCKQVFEKKSAAHMFCSPLCGERHRKGVDTKCSYNDGVQCAKKEQCQMCGWNPSIWEQRKVRLGV